MQQQLVSLAERVARLNPAAGEIGAGMLADLVERAQAALADLAAAQEIPSSCIPGRPTFVLLAPQGFGKTLFSAAIADRLDATHVIDGDDVNGMPMEKGAEVPTHGALILGLPGDLDGGDVTITAHTRAGFDAFVKALGIHLERRRPYSNEIVRGADGRLTRRRSLDPRAETAQPGGQLPASDAAVWVGCTSTSSDISTASRRE